MTMHWKKADALAAANEAARAIATAFGVPAPAVVSERIGNDWYVYTADTDVWTKAGAARLRFEFENDGGHLFFRFDDPDRAAEVIRAGRGGHHGALNRHSGKWNDFGEPERESPAAWVARVMSGLALVAEPNPPAGKLAAWRKKCAAEDAYWAQMRAELAASRNGEITTI